jgi:hypothetical protein
VPQKERAGQDHRLRLDRVRESVTKGPQKSTHRASRELEMSHVTVWRILRKRLASKPYRLQMLHAPTPEDHSLRHEFCLEFQERLQEEADKLVFSDERCYHLSGKVYHRNVCIWGTENHRATVQTSVIFPSLMCFVQFHLGKCTDHFSLPRKVLMVLLT